MIVALDPNLNLVSARLLPTGLYRDGATVERRQRQPGSFAVLRP